MKLSFLPLLAFLALIPVTLAWEKEDHEIFDLVSALESAEGKGTTFYSILDVPFSATTDQIAKAYRKKSMKMHPDKNPGVKDIQERFARLGVIATILRNKEGRERYDFFYKNGVPKWRGTGYYYERFRPGLGSVLVFLALLSTLAQYLILILNRRRDLERIDRWVKSAKAIAYGPKGVPIEGKRKVRVPVSGADSSDENSSRGRMLDLLVDGQDVFIVGPHDPVILDETMAPTARWVDTWVPALALSLYHRVSPPKDVTDDSTLAHGDGQTANGGPTEESGGETSDAAASALAKSSSSGTKKRKTGGKRK